MKTTNATLLRKDLFSSLDSVIEFNERIMVNTKKGNAVIISEEEYNSFVETVLIMSCKGQEARIHKGEKEKIDDMETFDPKEEW